MDNNETCRVVYFIPRIIVFPLACTDYTHETGTQKQAKMRRKNLEGQDNFEF